MTAEVEQYLRRLCYDNPKDFAALEAAKEDGMTLDELVRAALYDYIAMRALELGLPPFAARKKKTQTLNQRFAMLTRRMSAKARKLGPRFDDWLNTVTAFVGRYGREATRLSLRAIECTARCGDR